MVPDHITQCEENSASHHGGMHGGERTDRWTGPALIFPESAYVEWGGIISEIVGPQDLKVSSPNTVFRTFLLMVVYGLF